MGDRDTGLKKKRKNFKVRQERAKKEIADCYNITKGEETLTQMGDVAD